MPSAQHAPAWDSSTEAWLADAQIEVVGELVDASNATLYVRLRRHDEVRAGVYKPVAGEQPLWDFPRRTLHRREVACYRVCRAAGFEVVPPTILRDGPFGVGSLQLWVGPRPGEPVEPGAGVVDVCRPDDVPDGWLPVIRALGRDGDVVLCHADDPRLAAMAVLDVLTNNADRKGGHVLDVGDGRLAGVDHGLTFNVEPKLRTVLWGWARAPVPPGLLAGVRLVLIGLEGELGADLHELLDADEISALAERCERLLTERRFPARPARGPVIPWPAF